MYYTYILRCGDGSLYTGIAADIGKRMAEHFGKTPRCAKYTRSRSAEKLEAVWESPDRSAASRLEYRIKRLDRSKKQQLILSNDLSVIRELDTAAYRRAPEEAVEKWRWEGGKA